MIYCIPEEFSYQNKIQFHREFIVMSDLPKVSDVNTSYQLKNKHRGKKMQSQNEHVHHIESEISESFMQKEILDYILQNGLIGSLQNYLIQFFDQEES